MVRNGQPGHDGSPIPPDAGQPAAPAPTPPPSPFNPPVPTTPPPAGEVFFSPSEAAPTDDGAELGFLTIDDIAKRSAAAPTPRSAPRPAPPAPPQPAAETPPAPAATHTTATHGAPAAVHAVQPTPEPVVAPQAPPSASTPPTPPVPPLTPTLDPHVSASGAASQIAELLRAAHDTAARLRSHAEVEVKRSVEAARAEVQAHKQNQMRVLDAEQAAAEQLHAEIVHNARLAATELRTRAEEEAAEIKAAAQAVLAQAAAHAHAAKALVAHNLAEIEAAKQETAARGAELIGAGRQMIASIEGFDDDLSDRLVHTDQVIEWAQQATAPIAS